MAKTNSFILYKIFDIFIYRARKRGENVFGFILSQLIKYITQIHFYKMCFDKLLFHIICFYQRIL